MSAIEEKDVRDDAMNCNQELVIDYCAGALDEKRTAEFERHMEVCANCRRLVTEQRAVWESLDAWRPAEISPDFDARLYVRIGNERPVAWWRRWLQPAVSWKPAFPLATAAVLVAAFLLIRAPWRPEPVDTAQKVDIEQVEQALEDLDLLTPLSAPASGVM